MSRDAKRSRDETCCSPPIRSRRSCGGSGWSTYELARGLRARGHDDRDRPAATGNAGDRARRETTTASASSRSASPRPTCPTSATTSRTNGSTRSLADVLGRSRAARRVRHRPRAARAHGAAGDRGGATASDARSVCTVRDYWPVCYWSDLIHTRDEARRSVPACSARHDDRSASGRAPGALWPLALPMIPYMRAQPRAQAPRAGARRTP